MIQRRTPLKRSAIKRKPPRPKPSFAELLASGKVVKASSLEPRQKPTRKRAKSNTGWVDVAKKIWSDPANEHLCEVCGCWLGDTFSAYFYHHIIHRGHSRKLKREPLNLAQICRTDHDKAHEYGITNLAEEGLENPEGWMKLEIRLRALRELGHTPSSSLPSPTPKDTSTDGDS